jgi:CheY-like chemotaxis protein
MTAKPATWATENAYAASAKPSPARARLSARVLIVDDSSVQRLLFSRILGAFGLTVTTAADGRDAVDDITGGSETFDLVLMDIQMPELDGVAATKCIRAFEAAHPERPRLPIIALTANGIADEIEAYLAAGMDRHLLKPVDVPTLYATIAAFVPNGADRPADGSVCDNELREFVRLHKER